MKVIRYENGVQGVWPGMGMVCRGVAWYGDGVQGVWPGMGVVCRGCDLGGVQGVWLWGVVCGWGGIDHHPLSLTSLRVMAGPQALPGGGQQSSVPRPNSFSSHTPPGIT